MKEWSPCILMKSSLPCQLLRMVMRDDCATLGYWVMHTPLAFLSVLTATLEETLLALSHRLQHSTPKVKQFGISPLLREQRHNYIHKCDFKKKKNFLREEIILY